MTAEEKRIEKARAMRYKKPLAAHMNYEFICQELWDMQEVVSDVQWFTEDEDNLVNALNGDEDEAYEFRMAFSDLAAEIERFSDDLQNEYVPDCFNDLFPAAGAGNFDALFGYDSYEGDYFGLDPYYYKFAEEEAQKRIFRLTKKELMDAVRACLKVYASYVALRYRYDCLEASLNILREKNMQILKLFKAIEEQYDKAEEASNHFEYKYHKDVQELNEMLSQVPQEYWIQ